MTRACHGCRRRSRAATPSPATYVGRPETDQVLGMAMNILGNGLSDANREEETLSVREAELAMRRRLGNPERVILIMQSNLSNTYGDLGRNEEALRMRRDVYSGRLKLVGEEHNDSLVAAYNYAQSHLNLRRFEEAKSLLRRTMPVARRTLGESRDLTLSMRSIYAVALYKSTGATLDDLREAVATLEDTERTGRRVLGSEHPRTAGIEESLRDARAALAAREGADVSFVCDGVAAMAPGGV